MRYFQGALQVDPNYALAHVGLADAGALDEVGRGLDVDPHNPFSPQQLALLLASAGRSAEARARTEALLAAQPGFLPAQRTLWTIAFLEGRNKEGFDHAVTVLRDPELVDQLTTGFASGGYPDAMRRGAETLVGQAEHRYVSPVQIATLYAHADRADQALDWLENAVDTRNTQVIYAPVQVAFEPRRNDLRVRQILRRINLAEGLSRR